MTFRGVRAITFLAAMLLFGISALAAGRVSAADSTHTVTSPAGVLSVDVGTSGGFAWYAVSRGDQTVIGRSRLGFLLADQAKLERGLSIAGHARSSRDETWEQPWGERRFVRDRHNELRLTFAEDGQDGRRFDVVFRVFDDGVGFRYEFPDQPGLRTVRIVDELTEFNLAQSGTAWWIPAGEWNRYEYLYRRTPIAEVGQAHTPVTMRLESGLHVSFHEAALVDYSAMWLRRVEGTQFRVTLSPSPEGPKVVREAPFPTPWRTIQVSPDAAGLVMGSDLILNLNEPNSLGDVSWVVPHKYIGIWWGMHINRYSWAPGPNHGATTQRTREYIDFAARHGFRGVLVEGWNLGWDGPWWAGGGDFNFTTAYPDFDLEGLAAYARSKGVRLIGHHETSANVANYEAQLIPALDLYARLGVDSIKTGYVADAGQAQFRLADGRIVRGWHDSQLAARHHLLVVREAAARRIAINPHEPIKDTGLRRTYPNWVSREGARGQEYNGWGDPTNPPEHEVNLVFTRMLAGPMDFTPGIFAINPTQPGKRVNTTLAKQLALYVALYSPIQMAADLPEHYEANLPAFQFIKDVPTDWSETRVLGGDVGEFVAIARKDRRSEDWYVGAITDEHPRQLVYPLDFLTPGRTYRAEIYADGPDADWETNPLAISLVNRLVTSTDRLEMQLAPGGGQAVRFVALEPAPGGRRRGARR
jgi:alpha-glucosidase